MHGETGLLDPPVVDETGDETPEASPSTQTARKSAQSQERAGWGRLELGQGRVFHVWPRDDRDLLEALTAAIPRTSGRARAAACSTPSEGVLVVAGDHEGAAAVLVELRSSAATRLRPVAVTCGAGQASELRHLADVILSPTPTSLRQGLPPLEACAERVDQLADASDLPEAERCELDLLRYLATRDLEELAPVADADSPIAFRHPLAEALLRRTPRATIETLEEIRAAGYLESLPNERVFLCGACSSSRLSVREVCPSCRTPALVEEAIIHHFRCAHVGPSASFQRRGGLVCPKCERTLSHVGVDHDRPGVELHCQRCNEGCIEGLAEARCLDCDRCGSIDDLRVVDLPSYRPRPSLQRAAQRTISPLQTGSDLLRSALPTMEPAIHALLRDRAESICRRYGRPASVLRIEVEDLDDLRLELGRRELQRRIEAVARALATVLRDTDLVSVNEHGAMEIVLVETDLEGAATAQERIAQVLSAPEAPDLTLRFHAAPLISDGDA